MRYIVIFMCLCGVAFGQYKNLNAALVNGNKKVDIILYGNYMGSSASGYYTNNLYGDSRRVGTLGYINAQIGLGYTTGFFYNFRFAISFRAAQSLLNPYQSVRKDFVANTTNTIFGDSSVALGETFLEYFDGDTAIKLGRFQPLSEWISYLVDGISIRNASIKNLLLEGLWAYDYGRVSYYEISNFKALDDFGYFNIGATYYLSKLQKDIKNSAYINVYSTFIPGVFVSIGGRGHYATRFNNAWWIGANLGFTGSIEDSASVRSFRNNTFLFDSKIMAGYKNIDFMLGYVANGDAGMGSIGILGAGSGTQIDLNRAFYKNIQPFFVWGGRAIKMGANANLFYAAGKFSFLDSKLNAYVAYGATFFNGSRFYGGVNAKGLAQSELDAMIEYKFTNTLSAISHITTTFFSRGVPNIFELNGGVRFVF